MSQIKYLDLTGLETYHNRLRLGVLTFKDTENRSVTYKPGDSMDLTKGIYYATTSKTATRVSNPLTIKTLDEDIVWNGSQKETIDLSTNWVIVKGDADNSAVLKNMNNVANANGSVALGGSIISSIVGHYKLTGPIREDDGVYTYSVNLSSESINNIADFLSSTIDAVQQIYHNSDIRLIDFSATRREFTFSNPVDYIYRNRKYIANHIQDKYIPVGYYYTDELVGSHAEASGSTALGSATSKGVLSVAMNNGHSYGCDSVSEGRGGYNTKIGRHFQGEIINPDTDSEEAYAGSYGVGSHTEGNLTITSPLASYGHAEGHSTAVHAFAGHAEGRQTTAAGTGSHAEGNSPTAFGDGAHAEGFSNIEYGSIVYRRTDSPKDDLVDLWTNGFDDPDDVYDLEPKQFLMAYGDYSHAEGNNTLASGVSSHAQGTGSHASGSNSMAAGKDTLASGANAVAFGETTIAEGQGSITMGRGCSTKSAFTFVGGKNSKIESTSAGSSFVFGESNTVSGYQSTAFGRSVDVKKNRSFAAGDYLITNNDYEAAFGRYNKSNSGTTLFSVGNGASNNRQNAFEITTTEGYIYKKRIATNDDIISLNTKIEEQSNIITKLQNAINVLERRIEALEQGGGTDYDGTCADNYGTCADNAETCADNYGTCSDNEGPCADNYGSCADNYGGCADNYGTCADGGGCGDPDDPDDWGGACADGYGSCADNYGSCGDDGGTCADNGDTCGDNGDTCGDNEGPCGYDSNAM